MAAPLPRVLVTGAAGAIGSALSAGLAGTARLRLLDVRPPPSIPGTEAMQGDLHDPAVAHAATAGTDAVVHLAGIPREAAWEPILRNNIEAVYTLFEAARSNGVRRVVFASSNHAVGFYKADQDVDTAMPVRPDSRYGVSKVFGEALGRLYADKHGMDVACLRIGSYRAAPEEARQLATWCSPADLLALVRRCLDAPPFGFRIFYGVSNNRRRRWHDDAEAVLGHVPRDDAEAFVGAVGGFHPADPLAARFHGGAVCADGYTAGRDDPAPGSTGLP